MPYDLYKEILLTSLAAGGSVAIIIILIFVLFGVAFYAFGDDSADNYYPIERQKAAVSRSLMPPFPDLLQDVIGHFLVLHLVCMAGLFDEDQPVLFGGRHMIIQIAEKIGRVSVREIVISPYQQSAGMSDLLRLRKVSVFCRMDIIQQA